MKKLEDLSVEEIKAELAKYDKAPDTKSQPSAPDNRRVKEGWSLGGALKYVGKDLLTAGKGMAASAARTIPDLVTTGLDVVGADNAAQAVRDKTNELLLPYQEASAALGYGGQAANLFGSIIAPAGLAGKLAKGAKQVIGANAALGAAAGDSERDKSAGETLFGAALGGGGTALGLKVAAKTKELGEIANSEGSMAVQEALKKAGIDPSIGLAVQSPGVKGMEYALTNVPLIGTAGALKKTGKQINNWIKNDFVDYVKDKLSLGRNEDIVNYTEGLSNQLKSIPKMDIPIIGSTSQKFGQVRQTVDSLISKYTHPAYSKDQTLQDTIETIKGYSDKLFDPKITRNGLIEARMDFDKTIRALNSQGTSEQATIAARTFRKAVEPKVEGLMDEIGVGSLYQEVKQASKAQYAFEDFKQIFKISNDESSFINTNTGVISDAATMKATQKWLSDVANKGSKPGQYTAKPWLKDDIPQDLIDVAGQAELILSTANNAMRTYGKVGSSLGQWIAKILGTTGLTAALSVQNALSTSAVVGTLGSIATITQGLSTLISKPDGLALLKGLTKMKPGSKKWLDTSAELMSSVISQGAAQGINESTRPDMGAYNQYIPQGNIDASKFGLGASSPQPPTQGDSPMFKLGQ